MILYISANRPCSVLICSDGVFSAGMDETVFRLRDERHVLTLFPACLPEDDGDGPLPITVELDVFGNKTTYERHGNGHSENSNCKYTLFDWGKGRYELSARFAAGRRAMGRPCSLQRMAFPRRDGLSRMAELYCDSGIRLSVDENGSERSYFLTDGDSGSMSLLDVGRERLLMVRIQAGETEKLIALNGDFEIVAQIEGRSCSVSDGYLTAVSPLGTVLGHEIRTRYELRVGKLNRLPDETGFFTHERVEPSTKRATALAMMEAVMLERKAEAEQLLSAELKEYLEFDMLKEFFGSFSACRIAPFCTDEDIVCGIVQNAPKGRGAELVRFRFRVENGRISDITDDD